MSCIGKLQCSVNEYYICLGFLILNRSFPQLAQQLIKWEYMTSVSLPHIVGLIWIGQVFLWALGVQRYQNPI